MCYTIYVRRKDQMEKDTIKALAEIVISLVNLSTALVMYKTAKADAKKKQETQEEIIVFLAP